MSYSINTIDVFEKQAKRLIKKHVSLKKELLVLVQELKENPEQGLQLVKVVLRFALPLFLKGKGNQEGPGLLLIL